MPTLSTADIDELLIYLDDALADLRHLDDRARCGESHAAWCVRHARKLLINAEHGGVAP